MRLEHALEDWQQAVGTGPRDEPLGNWNHTRGVARIVRTFHELLALLVSLWLGITAR
ncbi:hypothetical protein [Streptomyces sp. NPDC086023]|uniref:hypothetical protein n=1 Tax=Streptomyces sp. NPDC086023 TaxID=3365746 RepID=UPI0037D1B75B